MTFQYRVRDPLGNTHEGTVDATNLEDASQQLRRDGFQVLSIEESDAEAGLLSGRVSRNDVLYVTNQLAIMVDTGITLSAALSGIVEQEPNPSLRKVLGDLHRNIAPTARGRHFAKRSALRAVWSPGLDT